MGTLNVRRLGYALGAEVTGVDATKPLDAETVAGIRQAWLDHIMICLPGQDLTPEQFRAFCAQFGALDTDNIKLLPLHPEMPDVVVRSNKPVALTGKPEIKKSGPADKWHSDFSHVQRPSTITFLLGKALPSVGGDTMFSNLYTAYETLSPAYQKMLEPLQAIHDVQQGAGYSISTPEEQARNRAHKPLVVHPVVRVHPDTGRKLLFLTERVRNFVGMTEEETRPFLEYLYLQHAIRYEFTYRHRWSVNDLVLWDNRCSLHNAVQDYAPELRMMIRCSLVGPKVGELLEAAAS